MGSPCLRRTGPDLRNFHLNRALFGNFLKCLAAGERGGLAGQSLPAPNGDVDISRVDLQWARLAVGSLRRDEDSAATSTRVENNIALFGTVPDCICNQANRLDCRVHLQLVHTARAKRIDPGIIPYIGPVASVLAKLKIIEVRSRSRFPNENQFVFGAIETAHAAVGLVPDAEIFQLRVDGISSCKHFLHMTPVHTSVMD